MIYTITLNPSIDYVMFTQQMTVGELNRTTRTEKYAGGKGINVSRLLKTLEIDSTATGYIGGFTGRFILDELEKYDIKSQFITLDRDTRINVKIKSENETEINASGPIVNESQCKQLLDQINILTPNDLVVVSGSSAKGHGKTLYKEIAKLCNEKQIPFIIDAEKELATQTFEYKPLLYKPNIHELEAMFDTTFASDEDIISHARKIIDQGVQTVIVSMGGDGALLITDNEVYKALSPTGEVINTVGAGDSTVAGFIYAREHQYNHLKTLKYAVASGSATAFSSDLAQKDEVLKLINEIKVQKLS